MVVRFVGSTTVVLIGTFLLHRRRSFVLTSTATNSFFFKYLPVWVGFVVWPVYSMKKISNADNLINDFG